MEQKEKLQEYEKRLQELTAEVADMKRQLEVLKQDAGLTNEKIPEPVAPKPVMEPLKAVLPEQAVRSLEEAEQKARALRKKDLEKTVGKSLMGVFASVLIFISLILFATLLLPYFNDVAKMITTYVLSFAFTGTGLWKLQKDKENKFYIALTGCGIGAVYISLLLSNFYFKVVGDIALYVLIALWAIAVCFLAKLKNQIFQIIGQLGITIAMIFGCALCIDTEASAKFFALVVFYLVSSGVFYAVHREAEYGKNRVHYGFNIVNFIALYAGCYSIIGPGFHGVPLLVLAVIVVYLVLMLLGRLEKAGADFGIIFSAYAALSYMMLTLMLKGNELAIAVVAYMLCAALLAALEWRVKTTFFGKQIAQIFLIGLMVYGLDREEALYIHGLALLVIVPLLLAGFIRRNNVFRYGSMLVFAIGYVFFDDAGILEGFLMGGLVLAAAFYLMYRFKEQYSRNFKWLVHILAVLFLGFHVSDVVRLVTEASNICLATAFAAWALFNVAMVKSVFGRNLQTGEKEKNTLYNVINLVAMVAGTILIGINLEEVPHLIVILTTLAAFLVNAKNLLDKRDNLFAGIYVGVKFTVLMITILGSFDTVNYLVSIACFVLAIISIVIGFKAEYRSLRLFGLALSIISTFKLIMVDISYENTLGNALSFFASGLLCFAISMIYNYIAKKRDKEEETPYV